MARQKSSQRQRESNAKQKRRRPEVERAELPGAQTRQAALFRRAELAPESLNPRDVRQLQRAVGNRAVGRLLTQTARPQLSPRGENTTGLPDSLKAGIESLSGTSLDDVKVHYNDSLPARHQALAYTQGTDIYLGPGQEQHLAHEAWHVVQQAQGRVSPTKRTQSDAPFNDDQALESEADVMGARAAGEVTRSGAEKLGGARKLNGVGRSGRAAAPAGVRQYKLQSVEADKVPTPAQSVKIATGVNVAKQLLPGGKVQPASSVYRPKKVEAIIDQTTLRTSDRANDKILSKVTAMARAEQRILQGTDLQKFYDAGHLVGDQLVAGDKTDSFEYWNLAPQVSSFNTPAYSGIEDKVKALAGSNTVRMEVALQYPPDYSVTVGHLKQRGIVTTSTSGDNTNVNFYRRIPNKWTMRAQVVGAQGMIGSGPTTRVGTQGAPGLGTPYFMDSSEIGAQLSPQHQPQLIGYNVSGEQWTPSTEVQTEDILSLLSSKFPDLGRPEEIAARIAPTGFEVNQVAVLHLIKAAAGDVALAQVDLSNRVSEMRDPSVLQEHLRLAEPTIRTHLNVARNPTTNLPTAVHHLVVAKSLVEALIEKTVELRDEQYEQFPFSLSQLHQFNENLPETKYAKEFDFSFTQLTPELNDTPISTEIEDEVQEQRSKLIELTGKYQARIPSFNGGELWMLSSTPPGLLYRQAVLIEGNQIVRVEGITKEVTLDNFPTGRWIIKYRDY